MAVGHHTDSTWLVSQRLYVVYTAETIKNPKSFTTPSRPIPVLRNWWFLHLKDLLINWFWNTEIMQQQPRTMKMCNPFHCPWSRSKKSQWIQKRRLRLGHDCHQNFIQRTSKIKHPGFCHANHPGIGWWEDLQENPTVANKIHRFL